MSILSNIIERRVPSDTEIASVLEVLRAEVEIENDEKKKAKLLLNYKIISYLVATGKHGSEVAERFNLPLIKIAKIVKTNFDGAKIHDLRKAYYNRLQKLNIEESIREELLGHQVPQH